MFKNGILTLRESTAGNAHADVLVAGDLCPWGRTEEAILRGQERDILADMQTVLSEKDLSIVNLEAPLTPQVSPIPKTGPNLRADPGAAALVTAGGFDVAACANNHIGDHGAQGVLDTLHVLRDNGIAALGAGENAGRAAAPLFFERKGLRIALLAFAEHEFGTATADSPGSAALDPLANIAQIRDAAARADAVLVLVHGGNEFNPVPSPRMKQTYRAFAEAGASAVIGGHTHCPQGIENWKGVPIVYSLGNFLFDWQPEWSGLWYHGMVVRIRIAAGGALSLTSLPYSFSRDARRVTPLSGVDREAFLKYLERISGILVDDPRAQRFWEGWCVMKGMDGIGWIQRFAYPFDRSDPDKVFTALAARNIFTCEAHCETTRQFLRLVEENRVEEAGAVIPQIKELQNTAWRVPDSTEGQDPVVG